MLDNFEKTFLGNCEIPGSTKAPLGKPRVPWNKGMKLEEMDMTIGERTLLLFVTSGCWFWSGVLATLALKHRLDFGNFGGAASGYGWVLGVGIILGIAAMGVTLWLASDRT